MTDRPTDEQLAHWVEYEDFDLSADDAIEVVEAMADELLELRRTLNSIVLEAAQRPPLGYPTPTEIAELRATTLYSYQAGTPDLESITSDWVRGIVSQPDGGLVDVIDTLARLVGGEEQP